MNNNKEMRALIDASSSILRDELEVIQKIQNHKRKTVFVIHLKAVLSLIDLLRSLDNVTSKHCDTVLRAIRGIERIFKDFKFYLDMKGLPDAWVRAKLKIQSEEVSIASKPEINLKNLFS